MNECDRAAMIRPVNYSEIPPPEALRHLVKLGWTLEVPDRGPRWITHVATPDGCLEVIRRINGRSRWHGEQPHCFVAGAITRPAALELGRGGRFVAARIWPWTWRAISRRSPADLIDSWADLSSPPTDFAAASSPDELFEALQRIVADAPSPEMVGAILKSRTCREASAATGLSPRGLQRWFKRHVGQPPQTFFRLLRFGDAFERLQKTDQSLARHALDHGFADQAHMAREFRSLAGTPAKRAQYQGEGPFVSRLASRSATS